MIKAKNLRIASPWLVCSFVAFVAPSALAYQTIEGHVTLLEPTYLPTVIAFSMDAGSSVCPAGGWLRWSKSSTDNNKAVYATLLSAFTTGKRVRFYINDGDTNCMGVAMHLID